MRTSRLLTGFSLKAWLIGERLDQVEAPNRLSRISDWAGYEPLGQRGPRPEAGAVLCVYKRGRRALEKGRSQHQATARLDKEV